MYEELLILPRAKQKRIVFAANNSPCCEYHALLFIAAQCWRLHTRGGLIKGQKNAHDHTLIQSTYTLILLQTILSRWSLSLKHITVIRRSDPTIRNPYQNRAALWRIFQQIKVRQPIGRKDSKQPVIPTSRRIRCIFVWSGSELWTLLKYSRSKLKNQCFFKAYPMIPLSGLIQSGRTVPLRHTVYIILLVTMQVRRRAGSGRSRRSGRCLTSRTRPPGRGSSPSPPSSSFSSPSSLSASRPTPTSGSPSSGRILSYYRALCSMFHKLKSNV